MSNDIASKTKHIANAVAKGKYRYTLHAAQQRIARNITRSEVEQILKNGEIIEDYPKHHYGPACLIFGRTSKKRVLHILCSLRETLDIITIYEPTLLKWDEDLKTRRKL